MFKKIIFLITLTLYITSPFLVYAKDISQNIKEPSTKPDAGFYYLFKRSQEKILEKFQFSNSSKLNFHKKLMLERLSELKYVAETKSLGLLQISSQRFSYEAGKVVEYAQDMTQEDKDDVKNQFISYKPLLEKLRDIYPSNSSFWMLIQYDIDTLDILSKKLN